MPDGVATLVNTETRLTTEFNDDAPVPDPGMDNAAKLYVLGVQLSETRRALIRSRTVVRLLRDAYRLDDFSSSVGTVAGRFLMLVTENMLCDCATLFRQDPLGGSNFRVVASVGTTLISDHTIFNLEALPHLFFAPGGDCPLSVVEKLSDLLGASNILGSLNISTGYALVIGGRPNATIDQRFCASDYELVEGALAVYIDVLDRRRTRFLLEQARQKAEAQDSERASLMVMLAGKMLTVLNELTEGLNIINYDHSFHLKDVNAHIKSMKSVLVEGRQVIEAAQEMLEETPPPIVLRPEWVHLNDFLLAVLRGAQPEYLQRGVDLRLKPFSSRLRVCIDRICMEIVLNALLKEILSLVGDGAEIAVEAQYLEDYSIRVIISSKNRSSSLQGAAAISPPGKYVFGKAAISINRLVEAHSATLNFERPDATSIRFILSLLSRDCRNE